MDSLPPDLVNKMVTSAADHWFLVAGMLALGYWIFPRVLRATLLNGGGDTIRQIIRTENDAQSVKNLESNRTLINDAIRAHTEIDSEKIKNALLQQQESFNGALTALRGELTDRWALRHPKSKKQKGKTL